MRVDNVGYNDLFVYRPILLLKNKYISMVKYIYKKYESDLSTSQSISYEQDIALPETLCTII